MATEAGEYYVVLELNRKDGTKKPVACCDDLLTAVTQLNTADPDCIRRIAQVKFVPMSAILAVEASITTGKDSA